MTLGIRYGFMLPNNSRPWSIMLLVLTATSLCNVSSPSFADDGDTTEAACSSLETPEAIDAIRKVRQSRLAVSDLVLVSVYAHPKPSNYIVFPVLPQSEFSAEVDNWIPMVIHIRRGLSIHMLTSQGNSAELMIFVQQGNRLTTGTTAPLSAILNGTLNTTIALPASTLNRPSSIQVCAEVVPPTYVPRSYAPRAPHGG